MTELNEKGTWVEIHDVVLKAASVGKMRRGLETSLVLSGVTLEKGRELAESYLGAIRWRP